jgi:KUP system potassium uptake protein
VVSKNILLLALGALGVVFGDIGTSPLYTVQTIFLNIPATPENVIGAISSIFWLLNLTVTLKYVIVIMRADKRGEGGIMALTSLASQSTQTLGGRQ